MGWCEWNNTSQQLTMAHSKPTINGVHSSLEAYCTQTGYKHPTPFQVCSHGTHTNVILSFPTNPRSYLPVRGSGRPPLSWVDSHSSIVGILGLFYTSCLNLHFWVCFTQFGRKFLSSHFPECVPWCMHPLPGFMEGAKSGPTAPPAACSLSWSTGYPSPNFKAFLLLFNC